MNSWKSDRHIMSVNIDGTETSWIFYWNMPNGNILQIDWSNKSNLKSMEHYERYYQAKTSPESARKV